MRNEEQSPYNLHAMWRLSLNPIDSMPRLAWLAEVDPARGTVKVSHGRSVECRDGWCVEGIWEGQFEAGDFHRVENFFGSGVRIDSDDLVFCASVAVIDRIFHVEWLNQLLVSNSLVQLLARTGARLDPSHDYAAETFASRRGIHNEPASIRVLHSDLSTVRQDYHCNLVINKGGLTRRVRSSPRSFQSFDGYYAALRSVLDRLMGNSKSVVRRYPLRVFTTLSTGYDSTAVSAVVRKFGVRECFTTDSGEEVGLRQRESGLAIAQVLGLTPHVLRSQAGPGPLECHFLAGCTDGSEVFYQDLASHVAVHCDAAVVFTGYYGDVVWNRGEGPPPYTDDIRRKDVSGLNISEVRLEAGFVNVPVPQIYARNLADIVAVSQSAEMRQWSLFNDYDRPIPRRIAETAGVPRNFFGMQKKAQLLYYNEPRNPDLKRDFRRFLRRELKLSRLHLRLTDWLHRLDYRFGKIFRRRTWLSGRLKNMRALMYVWAVNSLAARFQQGWPEEDPPRRTA